MIDPPETARLFLALWPPAPLQATLAATRQGWQWPPRAKLVPPASLHATLHFIGAVERSELPRLGAALAVPFTPFALELEHARLWPHGFAVLEPAAVPAPLAALHAALGAALHGCGVAVSARAFRPHLTLARQAAGAVPVQAPPQRWKVDQGYVLIESIAVPGQPNRYQILQQYY